jgi:5-formyltetrahydrofolate cyclo-ligase
VSVADDKAAFRTVAYARRKATFIPAARAAVSDALLSALEPHFGRPLSGYLPIRTEADPRPAMAHAARLGPVGVPMVMGSGLPLTFRSWTPQSALVEATFGVQVPQDTAEMVPEVLIVPMLAFDDRGYRLGYGGGFYDRTLERLRAAGPVLAIGFAFAAQRVDRLPIEATDQPLDLIVTEDGLTPFG